MDRTSSQNFFEQLRKNWFLIFFIGGLVVGWNTFSNRLNSVEIVQADQKSNLKDITQQQSLTNGAIIEIKANYLFIKDSLSELRKKYCSNLVMQSETQFGKGSIDKPSDFLLPSAWRHEEIAGAFQPAIWREKNPKIEFRTYPKRNQKTQSSCVAYVIGKQLAVDELSENGIYREMSPHSLYPYVAVVGGGANSISAHKLAVKQGMTLEHLFATDGLTEADVVLDKGYVTDAKQVALVYKPQSFVECASDFETIASILNGYEQQGLKKIVSVTVVGSNNGTWLSNMPQRPKPNESLWYHRIAVTDYGLINGKKVLAFDNSWGDIPGNCGQQFLSVEYAPYVYGAIYTLNLSDNWQENGVPKIVMPKYNWRVDLQMGSRGEDVRVLQQALQSMGMFPISSVVAPTGIFLGITKKSVELFQASFGINPTGIVDEMTRFKLNSIFVA